MKIFLIAAAAFSFAAPASAHPQHQMPANSQTPAGQQMPAGHQMPAQSQAQSGTSRQQMEHPGMPQGAMGQDMMARGMMAGCCRDANGNGKMDSCENMAATGQSRQGRTSGEAPADQPPAHQGH